MVVTILYFLVALALIYPIYIRSVRLNREQPEIWWEPREFLFLGALAKTVIWPLYGIYVIGDNLIQRSEERLKKELSGPIEPRDCKAIALGELDDVFLSLDHEKAMLESKGWNPVNLLKMNHLCTKAYEKHGTELYRSGWSNDEVFNLFDRYIPDTRLARLMKMK